MAILYWAIQAIVQIIKINVKRMEINSVHEMGWNVIAFDAINSPQLCPFCGYCFPFIPL